MLPMAKTTREILPSKYGTKNPQSCQMIYYERVIKNSMLASNNIDLSPRTWPFVNTRISWEDLV